MSLWLIDFLCETDQPIFLLAHSSSCKVKTIWYSLSSSFVKVCKSIHYSEWYACRWTPYGNTKCIICKQQVHQDGKYCHTCAYSKGMNCKWKFIFVFISTYVVTILQRNYVWNCITLGRGLCYVWEASTWHQVLQTEQRVISSQKWYSTCNSSRVNNMYFDPDVIFIPVSIYS